MLWSNGSLRVENALKIFLKYLREGICKIKQYLNYKLMVINQNIVATRLLFSNLQKNFYEKLYTKQTTSKTATTEFISKIPNRKERSNKQIHLCEAKILYMRAQNLKVSKVLKQIINSQVMMTQQQSFMNVFQIN